MSVPPSGCPSFTVQIDRDVLAVPTPVDIGQARQHGQRLVIWSMSRVPAPGDSWKFAPHASWFHHGTCLLFWWHSLLTMVEVAPQWECLVSRCFFLIAAAYSTVPEQFESSMLFFYIVLPFLIERELIIFSLICLKSIVIYFKYIVDPLV